MPAPAVKFVDGWGESGLFKTEAHAFTAEMAANAAVEIIDDCRIRSMRMGLLQKFFHFHTARFGDGSLLGNDASGLRDGNDKQCVEAGFGF